MSSLVITIGGYFVRFGTAAKELAIDVIRKFYSLLIMLWVFLILVFWQLDIGEFAAALIGAGPFALYYIYEELVKNPSLNLVNGIEYRKILGKGNSGYVQSVYPVIEVYATVENTGRVTAESCAAQISLPDRNYLGRWDAGRPLERINFAPNSRKKLFLMRLVPDPVTIKRITDEIDEAMHINEIYRKLHPGERSDQSKLDDISEEGVTIPDDRLEDTDFEEIDLEEIDLEEADVEENDPRSVEVVPTNKNAQNRTHINFDGIKYIVTQNYRSISFDFFNYQPIEVGGLKLGAQIPYPENHQSAIMAQKKLSNERAYWYIGKNIETELEFDVSISLSAENYGKDIDLGTIDLQEALEVAKWETTSDKYQSLRAELERNGWKNKL